MCSIRCYISHRTNCIAQPETAAGGGPISSGTLPDASSADVEVNHVNDANALIGEALDARHQSVGQEEGSVP